MSVIAAQMRLHFSPAIISVTLWTFPGSREGCYPARVFCTWSFCKSYWLFFLVKYLTLLFCIRYHIALHTTFIAVALKLPKLLWEGMGSMLCCCWRTTTKIPNQINPNTQRCVHVHMHRNKNPLQSCYSLCGSVMTEWVVNSCFQWSQQSPDCIDFHIHSKHHVKIIRFCSVKLQSNSLWNTQIC